MDVENLTKQFTRFFVPGLAFMFFCVFLPYALLGGTWPVSKDESFSVVEAVLLSVLAGYVLDSIKGYRWTLALRTYNAKKREVAGQLANYTGLSKFDNPDQHIALLWKKDEATYNRIFVERAEWVMILETSFALLVGALSIGVVALYRWLIGSPMHWTEEVTGVSRRRRRNLCGILGKRDSGERETVVTG
jgi:hypothetical protein